MPMPADPFDSLSDDVVRSIDALEALYGAVPDAAVIKVTHALTPLQQEYLDASPFVVVATVGPDGVDCSPRGDAPGFIRVVDPVTLQLPDRRGNNRIDSLRNIVHDGRIALLFLVPGVGVTLRVNGKAVLRTDAELRATFAVDGHVPATVIELTIQDVYTQCPKAFMRSQLWDADRHRDPADLPTVGRINEQITGGAFDGATYDAALPGRLRDSMY